MDRAPQRATASAVVAEDPSPSTDPVLEEEFVRLAQRDLGSAERAVVQGLLDGMDLWATGQAPERLPILATALAAAEVHPGPLLFLSPEAELLRSRQVRFGARARTWLIDVEGAPEALESTLAAVSGSGVIWCSLESLRAVGVRKRLAQVAPRALFVESAHAASPLAHEMRPSLALVPALRAACGQPPIVAFTRAAPEPVRVDAAARLGLSEPLLVRSDDTAPSQLAVISGSNRTAREGTELIGLVERLPRPTIVFCATPQEADGVFRQLAAAQVPVHRYHGGMSITERATEMLHFTLPGRRAVMVATSAFGPASGLAGVDAGQAATPEGLGLGYCRQKARSLVHFSAPASLEQYAAELALLSEDEETESVLFFSLEQIKIHRATLEGLRLQDEQIGALAKALLSCERPADPLSLENATGLGHKVLGRAVRLLEDAGVVVRTGTGIELLVSDEALLQVTSLLGNALLQMSEADRERLAAVQAFLTTSECRRSFLDAYWGASETRACGRCDVCETSKTAVQAGARARSGRLEGQESTSRSQGAVSAQRRAPARSWSVAASQTESPAVLQKSRRARQAIGS